MSRKLTYSILLILNIFVAKISYANNVSLQLYRSSDLQTYSLLKNADPSFTQFAGISCKDGTCFHPNAFCLSCIGAKNPDMTWFFQNIGNSQLRCSSDYMLSDDEVQDFFLFSSSVPIEYFYAYSPGKLQSPEMQKKFSSLCPNNFPSDNPTAIGFTDTQTKQLQNVSLILCQGKVFATQKPSEDCASTLQKARNTIANAKSKILEQYKLLATKSLFDGIKYDIIAFGNTMEAEYISCNSSNMAFCLALCNSSLSCVLPINNSLTMQGLTFFKNKKLLACTPRKLTLQKLAVLLKQPAHFAFTSSSLNLPFDIPSDSGLNTNFDDINAILGAFPGVFEQVPENNTDEFVVSSAFRKSIANQMQSFCATDEQPFFLGTGKKIEYLLCITANKSVMTSKPLVTSLEQCNTINREI